MPEFHHIFFRSIRKQNDYLFELYFDTLQLTLKKKKIKDIRVNDSARSALEKLFMVERLSKMEKML